MCTCEVVMSRTARLWLSSISSFNCAHCNICAQCNVIHTPTLITMAFNISLSSPSVGKCEKVLGILKQMGLQGDVTPNTTVTSDGTFEPGCRLLLYNTDVGAVGSLFKRIQRVHPDVECAHVKGVPNIVEGCIWNVIDRETRTKCPQTIRRCIDLHDQQSL